MGLRLTGRHDTFLLAGLAFALLTVFQSPVQRGLDYARDIERTYGVALIPALLLLSVMLVFHQHAKRREMKADAAAAASEARLAQARVEELGQLMVFSQALARVLTVDALREVVWRHIPALTDGLDGWVVLRTESGWDRLTDVSRSRWAEGEIENVADAAVARPGSADDLASGFEQEGHTCFLMHDGTKPIGVAALAASAPDVNALRKFAAAAALLSIAARNVQLFAEVRDHSVRDALTGCFNRAYTLDVIEAELARARRARAPLSILMFDVDEFKKINDRYGHLTGDRVLAAVGQRIRQVLRRSDARCRYGGDEFMVVLPETTAAGAARVGEWLRGEIESIDIRHRDERVPITASVGYAVVQNGELTSAQIIERADQALYLAKAAGRNCVRAFEEAASVAVV